MERAPSCGSYLNFIWRLLSYGRDGGNYGLVPSFIVDHSKNAGPDAWGGDQAAAAGSPRLLQIVDVGSARFRA